MKNQKGFGAIEALLILVIIGIIGGVGYYVYNANKNEPQISDSSIQHKNNSKGEVKEELPEEDPNEGYLVVKEWGLRFKIPDNLTDIQYKISGNNLGIFAKPIKDKNGQPFNVEYRNNYGDVDEYDNFTYSLGQLIRSKDSTNKNVFTTVKGKKVGDYYYYTAHSFSNLATGAGPSGVFFTDKDCLKDDRLKKCEKYLFAESIAFAIVNGSTSIHPETNSEVKDALLPSIELMQ
ncbi:MAG TPA: hypothetical protein VFX79_03365 [Candidatus Saccharimonadales bacterium]|nr:hypothetical protein [Candidatus Saccharimonadales bacterium]